ncbi:MULTISPECIES: ABC transporter permease subunit [unclassified Pseudoalteromonas]|uniref:ABC transporter permease n=1 Tax=unclassified Pseudoalteromonas TaxID=194690 RepID=UPI0025B353D6|nr:MULTISPECIES: ABC transporter permease subunit [unclassified Pseudoalteromonas]MDN3379801.1 ABC transporter permease subunit [Pseudoalteromonas sp. APC 3893]MDN3388073.1 ABC transporter permease subunit [Pseudoalteromonas sp. APC 4017]
MIKSRDFFTQAVLLSPKLLMALLILPVLGGLVGVLLPAFGYIPALNKMSFSLEGFTALFNTPGFCQMVLLSISSALASTLLAFVITTLILACYFNSPWLYRIQRLLGPILVIPHAAAAIAISFLITPSGMISRLFSPWLTAWQTPPDWLLPHDSWGISMILGLTLKELPFLLLMALGALSQADLGAKLRAQHKIALSLGYCPMTAFFKVVLPNLYPFLRLPLLAVLAYASANVEIPLILGPNAPPTLAVAIMHWFNDVDLTLRIKASAGAIIQLVLTVILLVSWWLLEKLTKRVSQTSIINGKRDYAGHLVMRFTHATTFILISCVVLSLAGLVLWSFAGYWRFPASLPDQFVTMHWHNALMQMHTSLINTLLIGFAATFIAIIFALFTLEAEQQRAQSLSRFASLVIYLPMLIPSIAFLFGLVWLQEQVNSQHALFNVIFSHLLFVVPYVFLSLASSYRRLDPRFANLAASLGATPANVFWRVKLPMLMSPICIAFALGLAISFSQYLPTLLNGGGRIDTITTEAVTLASGASRRVSSVYALMQMLLPALAFALAWFIPKLLNKYQHKA